MRITIGLVALATLAACGGNKGANSSANTANTSTNATAPANSAAATNMGVPAATAIAARPVRIGIDGAQGMDACHTNGRLSGQDTIGILDAPNADARRTDGGEPGLIVEICETAVPGWVGIVWKGEGDPEHDCGTGANLPGPKNYDGPCRSGWVPEQNVEVTAG